MSRARTGRSIANGRWRCLSRVIGTVAGGVRGGGQGQAVRAVEKFFDGRPGRVGAGGGGQGAGHGGRRGARGDPRLRKRYRQLLRDEISNTLSDPAMVIEEMRALFGAFSV